MCNVLPNMLLLSQKEKKRIVEATYEKAVVEKKGQVIGTKCTQLKSTEPGKEPKRKRRRKIWVKYV